MMVDTKALGMMHPQNHPPQHHLPPPQQQLVAAGTLPLLAVESCTWLGFREWHEQLDHTRVQPPLQYQRCPTTVWHQQWDL